MPCTPCKLAVTATLPPALRIGRGLCLPASGLDLSLPFPALPCLPPAPARSCQPEALHRTLCTLLGRQLNYRLLVAGHDFGAGVREREQTTAEALQASMRGLDCSKYHAGVERPLMGDAAAAAE